MKRQLTFNDWLKPRDNGKTCRTLKIFKRKKTKKRKIIMFGFKKGKRK